jgi:hypothetical protein
VFRHFLVKSIRVFRVGFGVAKTVNTVLALCPVRKWHRLSFFPWDFGCHNFSILYLPEATCQRSSRCHHRRPRPLSRFAWQQSQPIRTRPTCRLVVGNESFASKARRAETSSAGVEGPGYKHKETKKARRADTPKRDTPNKPPSFLWSFCEYCLHRKADGAS